VAGRRKKAFVAYLTDAQLEQLRALRDSTRVPITVHVRMAIDEYLATYPFPDAPRRPAARRRTSLDSIALDPKTAPPK